MNMIAIQEAYIARLLAANAKIGKRSSGLAFARTKRAARKEAESKLIKLGYYQNDAAQIVSDAFDMFVLERACTA